MTPTFTGRVVGCSAGYATFDRGRGDMVTLTSAVPCEYLHRYSNWRVYAQAGGAHPDHIDAIEPAFERWEMRDEVRVVPTRRWRWFNWIRK